MQPDLLYYRRRQAEEAAAAIAAHDPKVSAVHRELARRYDARVKEIELCSETMTQIVSAA